MNVFDRLFKLLIARISFCRSQRRWIDLAYRKAVSEKRIETLGRRLKEETFRHINLVKKENDAWSEYQKVKTICGLAVE